MKNFVYVIADADTRECVLVDACWDVPGILGIVDKYGLKPVGAVVTHCHFDHVGGLPPPPFDQFRIRVTGLATLIKKFPKMKGYIHALDLQVILKESNPGLDKERFVLTEDGFEMTLGSKTKLKFLHTPGHTRGSQCILVNDNRLLSGDTLFLGCCGRLDMPGANIDAMWSSLMRLRSLDEEVVVYPGHCYGGDWTTVGEEKLGGVLKEISLSTWRRKMRERQVESSDEEDTVTPAT